MARVMNGLDFLAERVAKLEAEVLDLRERAGLVPSPWCPASRPVENGFSCCVFKSGHEGPHKDHTGIEWPRMTPLEETAARCRELIARGPSK